MAPADTAEPVGAAGAVAAAAVAAAAVAGADHTAEGAADTGHTAAERRAHTWGHAWVPAGSPPWFLRLRPGAPAQQPSVGLGPAQMSAAEERQNCLSMMQLHTK